MRISVGTCIRLVTLAIAAFWVLAFAALERAVGLRPAMQLLGGFIMFASAVAVAVAVGISKGEKDV